MKDKKKLNAKKETERTMAETIRRAAEHNAKMQLERAMEDPMNYNLDEYVGPGSEADQH